MKGISKHLVCLVSLCLLAGFSIAADRESVAENVLRHYENGAHFTDASPFSGDSDQSATWKKAPVAEVFWLRPDLSQLAGLSKQPSQTLRFRLPGKSEDLYLDLVRSKVTTDDFRVFTDSGETVAYQDGAHYRGIVSGREDTTVALSIFEDKVMALIATPEEGEMVLGPYGQNDDRHVFYKTSDLVGSGAYSCDTEEPANYFQEVARLVELGATNNFVSKCVEVYLECDYALYQNKGGTTQTVNFVTGMFNMVATIYQNEQITTRIKETKVWTSADSYSRTSSSTALNQFQGTQHNSDLAHLIALGGNNLGGVAWVNVICDNSYGYAYSNINSSYSSFPTYSWTVGVVTHEMGHNLGSPHTHSCSWSGGALDNCYTPEGSCSRGPAPSNGGTIMSYCHLTSAGINFNNGFGQQPGDLIRGRVSSASCLGVCDDNPPTGTELQDGVPLTNQSASTGQWLYYTVQVPVGTSELKLTTVGSDPDADLYVRRSGQPTENDFDCRSWTSTSNETCTISNPASGTWYVGVFAYSAFGGLTIQADLGSSSVCDYDDGASNLSGNQGQWQYFTVNVPSCTSLLQVDISGGSGDADLYLRYGSQPTTSSYNCRPYLNGNNESCSQSSPQSGTWHIGIRAYSSYSGVQLNIHYE